MSLVLHGFDLQYTCDAIYCLDEYRGDSLNGFIYIYTGLVWFRG